jgi:diguanylate cyclase (GGDEF)-like protein
MVQRPKGTILFVEDSEMIRQIVQVGLGERGYKVVSVPTGEEAFGALRLVLPDLVLLDINLPDIDGYVVCKRIKADPLSHHIPVVMATSLEETGFEIMAIEAGADDFVSKPIDPVVLDARINMLLRRVRRERFANPLTGLPSDVIVEQRIGTAFESGAPFAVCPVDIDDFKAFNDRYGYPRGDEVLAHTARIVADAADYRGKVGAMLDEGDDSVLVGHLGGDNFVYVCPARRAHKIAERIVDAFDATILEHYDEEDAERGHFVLTDRRGDEHEIGPLSISVAIVSTEHRTFWSPLEMLDTADEMKAYAKTQEGSIVVEDRRGRDGGERGQGAAEPGAESGSEAPPADEGD